jgi:hypothetical protein
MVTKRSALALFLANIAMFYCATFVVEPWDIVTTVSAALCGTATLHMHLVVRARGDNA